MFKQTLITPKVESMEVGNTFTETGNRILFPSSGMFPPAPLKDCPLALVKRKRMKIVNIVFFISGD